MGSPGPDLGGQGPGASPAGVWGTAAGPAERLPRAGPSWEPRDGARESWERRDEGPRILPSGSVPSSPQVSSWPFPGSKPQPGRPPSPARRPLQLRRGVPGHMWDTGPGRAHRAVCRPHSGENTAATRLRPLSSREGEACVRPDASNPGSRRERRRRVSDRRRRPSLQLPPQKIREAPSPSVSTQRAVGLDARPGPGPGRPSALRPRHANGLCRGTDRSRSRFGREEEPVAPPPRP